MEKNIDLGVLQGGRVSDALVDLSGPNAACEELVNTRRRHLTLPHRLMVVHVPSVSG